MSKPPTIPSEVIIDGVKITPALIETLKDLIGLDLTSVKNCIARNSLFIMSIPSDNLDQIEKEFFGIQMDLYRLLEALNGDNDNHEGGLG